MESREHPFFPHWTGRARHGSESRCDPVLGICPVISALDQPFDFRPGGVPQGLKTEAPYLISGITADRVKKGLLNFILHFRIKAARLAYEHEYSESPSGCGANAFGRVFEQDRYELQGKLGVLALPQILDSLQSHRRFGIVERCLVDGLERQLYLRIGHQAELFQNRLPTVCRKLLPNLYKFA